MTNGCRCNGRVVLGSADDRPIQSFGYEDAFAGVSDLIQIYVNKNVN